MGVKNLWRLLLPISRRISIQSLSHQTLAIDASIWLTQISKACRDPETGRLLPNRPHVRIFLLRLMRLLFHEIRPVVVFDGVMPEVKRREIQRRRDRREKLWRDEDDEADGTMGGGAMRRTAKKILVQRLKGLRKKDAVAGFDESKNGAKHEQSDDLSGDGAFVSGFNPGDSKRQTSSTTNDQSTKFVDMKKGDTNKEVDDEIISIHPEEELQQSPPNNNDSDSENDWEMSHAVQSSIDNSLNAQQQPIFSTDSNVDQPNETIASLPTITRTQWIDSQFRAQRIQSRQECISVAADMKEYSSTQLRNFLKGSRLNKKMNDIGVLAGKMAREGDGDRLASSAVENVSMQFLFGEDDSGDDQCNEGTQPEHSNSDAVPDDEGSGGGFLLPSSDPTPTKAKSMECESDTNGAIDLQYSDDERSSEGQSHAGAEDEERINNIDDSANNTTADRPNNNPSSQLLAFASADNEWADWGKDDSDSEKEMKHHSTLKSNASQLGSQHYDSDSCSDDEQGVTFLTLGNGSQKNNPATEQVNTKSVQTYEDRMKDTVATCRILPEATTKAEEDENGDMESVDWEDGNFCPRPVDKASTRENGANITFVNAAGSSIKESPDQSLDNTAHAKVRPSASETAKEIIEIQSDDEICWEDGSATSKVGVQEDDGECWEDGAYLANTNGNVALESKVENAIATSEGAENSACQHDISTANSVEREQAPAQHEDLSDDICDEDVYDNQYIIPQPENPNIAALQHAQETASRLTNWAGRAVQRAFAAHLEQHKEQTSPPEPTEAKSSKIDLTGPENDVDSPGAQFTDQEVNRPENDTKRRNVEFLDTSLEGLNAVHRAILEEEKTMERDMSTITDEMKEDILKLLELCGIPWIESPAEAEAQCAALEEVGLVDGIVTEDSDVFVFGGRKVYKNFFNEQQYVEAYYARDAQKELGLGKNQLVALAMLLGSDYTDGVKGVGIVNGMEILQAFPSEDIREGLQAFRDWLDGFGDPPAMNEDGEETTYITRQMLFHKKHKSARTRWVAPADFPSNAIINAYVKPAVDKSNSKFSWAKPRIDGLQQFCAETLGWDQEETDRVVLPVLKVLESKSKQRRLESYFMKYDDGIKFAEVRSKRLKTVLEGVHSKSIEVDYGSASENPGNNSSKCSTKRKKR